MGQAMSKLARDIQSILDAREARRQRVEDFKARLGIPPHDPAAHEALRDRLIEISQRIARGIMEQHGGGK